MARRCVRRPSGIQDTLACRVVHTRVLSPLASRPEDRGDQGEQQHARGSTHSDGRGAVLVALGLKILELLINRRDAAVVGGRIDSGCEEARLDARLSDVGVGEENDAVVDLAFRVVTRRQL